MNLNTIYPGDCLEVLKTLPSNSVNCVVTSPPYWALRDYGTGTWDGGDPFFGAGTTGVVALKQNKSYIGIELNPEYISIAEKRLHPYLTQTKLAL